MSDMTNWIDEALNDGNPKVNWIDSFVRGDGAFVDGHFRTDANQTPSDNIGTDIDGDGIPGFFDADANGNGILESFDLDSDGIVDIIDIDGDGIADMIIDSMLG